MILDEVADLFEELNKEKTCKQIANTFDKERKWVSWMKLGYSFKVDAEFVAGLKEYGYELKLVKLPDRQFRK